jgi:hypothetical protein
MKKIKGGKAIASGGFGCVFKPAIKCKTRKNKEAGITKLMKTKYAKAEYKEIQEFKGLLDDIPNYSDYFLLDGFSLCEPEELTNEDLEKFDKKCKSLKKIDITASNVNKSLDKLLSLNMPYGGVDVGDYVEREKMDYKKIHKMNEALIELLKKGIVQMNERNVYHCDIKDSNILVKDDGHADVKTRLIDWGLSTTYKSGEKIAKPLTNRPFQFNVPFSVVLFNDTFTKMYAEFLKKHKEPTFFIIRSFVINYVISWVNKRGPGHLKALNSIFKEFFERGLINIEEQFKDDLIEFDYTFYFIFEYISYVLFKFTRDGKFEKMEYFSQVFLKNLDIWGFTMTYLPILEYLSGYYNKLCDCELEIIEKIKEMILYVIECSYVPIDIDKIVTKLEDLNALFLKADKKSTVYFQEKRPTSSLTISKPQKSTTKTTKTTKTTTKTSKRSSSSKKNRTMKKTKSS